MMVGIVDHEVGTRDIRRLGGLMALMPFTFTIAVIGSMSMAGLPPFNGFLSKEMFFKATVDILQLNIFSVESFGFIFPVVAWTASVFTFVYCVIIIGRTFFGKLQPDRLEKPPHEAPIGMLISPFVLVAFVIGIFFFPNILRRNILAPAMQSIYPSFPAEELTVPIEHFHIGTELFMTIGVIIIGILLYRSLPKWRAIYQLFSQKYTLNAYYERIIGFAESKSGWLTRIYMNGNLTYYFAYIYIIFVTIVAGYFVLSDAFTWSPSQDSPVEYYEMILLLIMVFAAVALLFAKGRITTVLLNGVLGYSVAFFFVVFRAPDLALTQLVVESVTTALFLLCFKFLPDLTKEKVSRAVKFSKATISIFVGATVTLVGLSVLHYEKFEPISAYFEDSYNLAGGKNIVNTILGDFRAFDTMLEVVVLFIAGLGIYTLIKLKAKKGETDVEN